MGWPSPVYTVNATDQAGIDVYCGSQTLDFKAHRTLHGPPDNLDIVLEDKLRLRSGAAMWQAHIWPELLPNTVVLISQPDAARFLIANHEALGRLRHVSSEGTVFYTPSFSLLEATLPRDRVLKVTVSRSSL
jgi:hypothetical protein